MMETRLLSRGVASQVVTSDIKTRVNGDSSRISYLVLIFMPNSFIYLRVSTREQAADGGSLPAQHRKCLAYHRRRNLPPLHDSSNMDCAGVFSDPGVSAWKNSPFVRPGFLALWSKLVPETTSSPCLLIECSDRFSISVESSEELRKRGVHFHFVSQQSIPALRSGRLLMQIAASFAEFKSSLISERIKEAHAIRRELGLSSSRIKVKSKLVVDESFKGIWDQTEEPEQKPQGTVHGYVRVSTGEQSTEAQIEIVERMTAARVEQGYKPGCIWIDEEYRPSRLPSRIVRWAPRCSPRSSQEIWLSVIEWTECSGRFRTFSNCLADLMKRNIYVSIGNDISTDTEAGRRAIPILVYMAEMESADLGWRRRLGLKFHARCEARGAIRSFSQNT